MVSERSVRTFHTPIFILIAIMGIINLGISGSLVSHYNSVGYPNISYRDRIRILLAASIWTVFLSLYLLIGVIVASSHILFGIASHIFSLTIGFLLFMIGSASLTALTRYQGTFDRSNIIKALVGVAWTETILLLIALLGVLGIGLGARKSNGGFRGPLVSTA